MPQPSANSQFSDSNYDARSHYSDSAAAPVTATTTSLFGGSASGGNGGGGAGGHGSAMGGAIDEIIPHPPLAKAFSNTMRGTSYFKSNQSLCSCNADTEVDVSTVFKKK